MKEDAKKAREEIELLDETEKRHKKTRERMRGKRINVSALRSQVALHCEGSSEHPAYKKRLPRLFHLNETIFEIPMHDGTVEKMRVTVMPTIPTTRCRSFKHRILVRCPRCLRKIGAGKFHQHVC